MAGGADDRGAGPSPRLSGETVAGAKQRSRAEIDSGRVSAIVQAAEEAAERIRGEAEWRMRERVAEGTRAAENRVRAAEDEANAILDEARSQAQRMLGTAQSEAEHESVRASEKARDVVSSAEEKAAKVRREAQDEADTVRREARETAEAERLSASREAQELSLEARGAADAAREQGQELTGNLQELGASLRANAERLMRDIHRAHQALTSRLDAVDAAAGTRRPVERVSGSGDGRRRDPAPPPDGQFDVPEFLPPG